MPLSGSQLNLVHSTILAAYTRDELRRGLRVCMDLSFDDYAPDKGFADQLWALIEWTDRHDRLKELVRCSYENNDTNVELATLWSEAQTWDWTRSPSSIVDDGRALTYTTNSALVAGGGAVAQKRGVAAGKCGIAIGGNVYGNITLNDRSSDSINASSDSRKTE